MEEEILEPVKKQEKKIKKEKHNKYEEENILLKDKILRLNAEMQNIQRRNSEEIAKLCKYDGEQLIIKLLGIVDNFERAILLDDADLTNELSQFLSGFKMIYSNLLNILESLEVKEIDCIGAYFDPNCMEAVLTQKEEGVEAGKVIDVLQKGYTYKDKVIRVAFVKVSE